MIYKVKIDGKIFVLSKCIYFQNNIAVKYYHSRHVFLTYINKNKLSYAWGCQKRGVEEKNNKQNTQ